MHMLSIGCPLWSSTQTILFTKIGLPLQQMKWKGSQLWFWTWGSFSSITWRTTGLLTVWQTSPFSICFFFKEAILSNFWHVACRWHQQQQSQGTTFLDILSPAFQSSYTPHKAIAVDESMITLKGRVSFCQYLKGKPHPWGIKAFALSNSLVGFDSCKWCTHSPRPLPCPKRTPYATTWQICEGNYNKWLVGPACQLLPYFCCSLQWQLGCSLSGHALQVNIYKIDKTNIDAFILGLPCKDISHCIVMLGSNHLDLPFVHPWKDKYVSWASCLHSSNLFLVLCCHILRQTFPIALNCACDANLAEFSGKKRTRIKQVHIQIMSSVVIGLN